MRLLGAVGRIRYPQLEEFLQHLKSFAGKARYFRTIESGQTLQENLTKRYGSSKKDVSNSQVLH